MNSRFLILILFPVFLHFHSGSFCHASQGETGIFIHPRYMHIYNDDLKSRDALGISLEFSYGLSDFFNFIIKTGCDRNLSGSDNKEKSHDSINNLRTFSLGLGYMIDAVTWIPEIFGLMGVYTYDSKKSGTNDEAMEADFGIEAGFSILYRPLPYFSAGAELSYHAFFRGFKRFPAILATGLRIGYYF
jgi:hypothetical protein